jgi:hypothetical protein
MGSAERDCKRMSRMRRAVVGRGAGGDEMRELRFVQCRAVMACAECLVCEGVGLDAGLRGRATRWRDPVSLSPPDLRPQTTTDPLL